MSTTDKTLVSWFCFDEEAPKHCSVITVQAADKYDALTFGQDAQGKWSTASDDNTRTQTPEELSQNPAQEIGLGQFMKPKNSMVVHNLMALRRSS